MKTRILVLAWSMLLVAVSAQAATGCKRPWVFFDLGNTVVDTKTNNYRPMFYMRDVRGFRDGAIYNDAKDYLDALVRAGFKLGTLIDIPGNWGVDYPAEAPIRDLRSAKVARLMDFILGAVPEDEASWEGTPMDWSPFGKFSGQGQNRLFKGTIYVPMDDSERKGSGSPVLFQRAQANAARHGCKIVYLGENEKEMTAAETAGLFPFQVEKTDRDYFYLPPDRISDYVNSYKSGAWHNQAR